MNDMELQEMAHEAALHFLSAHGYEIVDPEWECPSRTGKGIVAADGDTLVFIETMFGDARWDKSALPVGQVLVPGYRKASAAWVKRAPGNKGMRRRFDVFKYFLMANNKAVLRLVNIVPAA